VISGPLNPLDLIMEKAKNNSRRTFGMLLTLVGFSGVSAILLGWVPGWRWNVAVLLV